jgi:excisionase family DNA binding protein
VFIARKAGFVLSTQVLLTKKDVANILKCSVSKIEKMMAAGEITYKKIGGMVRFRPSDVEPFFAVDTLSPGSRSAHKQLDELLEKTTAYGSERGRR